MYICLYTHIYIYRYMYCECVCVRVCVYIYIYVYVYMYILHTRNRHLRHHRGLSVAFSNGCSVAFSNGTNFFSGMFKRIVTFPVKFTGDFKWTLICILQWNFTFASSGNILPREPVRTQMRPSMAHETRFQERMPTFRLWYHAE